MDGLIYKKIEGLNMCLNPNDNGISGVLINKGNREKAFMKILKNNIKKEDVCIDLGANIGYSTLFMCKNVGSYGKVYAIEPDPRNFKILKRNIECNKFQDRCEHIRCAISDRNGKLNFWMSSTPNTSSVHKTNKSKKCIEVNAFTLDEFLKDKKYPNFIKMDVEGHEVNILKSGFNYFFNNKGNTKILLEVHPSFYNANNMELILRKYFDIGFEVKYVISTPIPQPAFFKDKGYKPIESIPTDGFIRGIYNNISEDDLILSACYENEERCQKDGKVKTSKKIVRSFMMERNN